MYDLEISKFLESQFLTIDKMPGLVALDLIEHKENGLF